MIKIAHIINPVDLKPPSDLVVAQPVTFETMRRALETAKGVVDVELYTTQYPEDHAILPDGFSILPDLERSVLDVGNFNVPRKLPLLKDILDRLYEATDADYLIYTNVDIALMPYFYTSVAKMLETHDGLIINRRDIPNIYTSCDELPLMIAEIGEKHAGFDCLVFPRKAYPLFYLGDIAIGIAKVGFALYTNMLVYCENVKEFRDSHMTFHIGSDRRWLDERLRDYETHNEVILLEILKTLREVAGATDDTTPLGRFLLDIYQRRASLDYAKDFLLLDNKKLPLKENQKLKHKLKRLIRVFTKTFRNHRRAKSNQ